jgi:4'-phosphopantetheinyl transferase
MRWFEGLTVADSLPAVWIIATAARPRNRTERSALRHATSRRLIALQMGLDESDIRIGNEPTGRPSPGVPGLWLSHATRGGVVAVALAERAIGVDVEQVGLGPIPLAALHPAEQLWLNQVVAARRDEAFAQMWAVKEAYGKWRGVGLPEPDSFAALPDASGDWRITAEDRLTVAVRSLAVGDGRFAVAMVTRQA